MSTGGLSFSPSSQPNIFDASRFVPLLSEDAADSARLDFSTLRSEDLLLDRFVSTDCAFSVSAFSRLRNGSQDFFGVLVSAASLVAGEVDVLETDGFDVDGSAGFFDRLNEGSQRRLVVFASVLVSCLEACLAGSGLGAGLLTVLGAVVAGVARL